ncbi:hypothetical protein [Pedobacter ureilyticus]|uniref:Uncharacterized protein n=1 Tax=Pedobacter ureilyticus TaxID=1393051 RepID=A0ABW9J4L3_9SPHI|nr:hypothetical protein [Pedobacter helvus]
MEKSLVKHVIIRVIVGSLFLFLLHFAQIDYEVGESLGKIGLNESAIAFIGALVLFGWIIFMAVEVVKYLKTKLKWFAIANILIIVLTIVGFFFVQLLLALASC